MDDVISLNIRGEVMVARRRTLCQVSGSYLDTMLSGRWSDGLEREQDGRVSLNLDLNPVCFRALLDALAHDAALPGSCGVLGLYADSDVACHPCHDCRADLKEMLDFLCLPSAIPARLHASAAVAVDGRGRLATQTGCDQGYGWAIGGVPLPAGHRYSWDVVIQALRPWCWCFIGVLLGPRDGPPPRPERPESYAHPGSYGWSTGAAYAGGSASGFLKQKVRFSQGDRVTLTLDAAAGSLCIEVSRQDSDGHWFQQPEQRLWLPGLQGGEAWYVHFNLFASGSALECTHVKEVP